MTDFYGVLLGKTLSGGGGGGGSTLITKNITANGTYNASSDNADGYSAVSVDVPNTYTQADNGKVVDNGALVSQTSSSTTTNGTVDTTLINSLSVNVPNTYTAGDEGKVVDNGELVSQTSVTYDTNGTYDTTTINSVTVNVSGQTPQVERSDVNFYDYDGTLVNSYTAQEFLELTAMPANPTHTGLTAQGWNWTLSDAKTYVTSYGKLEIGQNYVTTDGKTRYYITIRDDVYNSPSLWIYLNSGASCEIDWGDNSTPDSITTSGTQTKNHTYASTGDYVISITVSGGTVILMPSNDYTYSPYPTFLTKVEIGSGVESIGTNCFELCYNLKTITIPSSVATISDYAFSNCYNIEFVTIPQGVTAINSAIFNKCACLKAVTIPQGVTTISNYAFSNCYNIEFVTIPSGVTTIGEQSFSNCYKLINVTIPSSVTTIENSCFKDCLNITDVTIPFGVTNIRSTAFGYCYSLKTITIPSSVTTISDSIFPGCASLATITINKAEGSLSGSPWDASYATVVWTG